MHICPKMKCHDVTHKDTQAVRHRTKEGLQSAGKKGQAHENMETHTRIQERSALGHNQLPQAHVSHCRSLHFQALQVTGARDTPRIQKWNNQSTTRYEMARGPDVHTHTPRRRRWTSELPHPAPARYFSVESLTLGRSASTHHHQMGTFVPSFHTNKSRKQRKIHDGWSSTQTRTTHSSPRRGTCGGGGIESQQCTRVCAASGKWHRNWLGENIHGVTAHTCETQGCQPTPTSGLSKREECTICQLIHPTQRQVPQSTKTVLCRKQTRNLSVRHRAV